MKRTELLIVLSFLLFVQGYLFENIFSAVLAFGLVVYLTYLRTEFKPEIDAARELNRTMQEGKRDMSRLKIRNAGKIDIWIRVKEKLPPGFFAECPEFMLKAFEERYVEYPITPARGTYTIEGPLLEIMDTRRLFCTTYMVDSQISVDVYPSLDRIKDEVKAEENVRLAEAYRRFLFGLQTPEIQSLRRFQEGDELRHIDWKATARMGELIVREFLKESEGDVYIILDAGREMRKGMKDSKIDYATTLTIALAYALRRYRVGLIVYDDYGVLRRVEASQSPSQIERILRSLNVSPLRTALLNVRVPRVESFGLRDNSRQFLERLVPILKRRKSISSGLLDSITALPPDAFLIFISDITSHTGELMKVFLELKNRHRILLLTPNPVLFYDESKLTKEKVVWLYRRYVERERLIKSLNRIVPTIDIGPSDLAEVVRGVLK